MKETECPLFLERGTHCLKLCEDRRDDRDKLEQAIRRAIDNRESLAKELGEDEYKKRWDKLEQMIQKAYDGGKIDLAWICRVVQEEK